MITDFISRSNIAANFGSWRRCGLLLRALVVFLGFAACFASPGAAQSNWQNQSKAETGGQNMAHVGDVLAGKRLLLQQDDIMLLQVNQPEPSNPTVTTTIVPFHTENSNYQPPQFPQLIQLGHNLSQTAFAPGSIFSSSGSGRMFNTNNDVVVVLKNSLQLSDLTPAWFVDLWDPAAGSNGWTQELEVKSALEPNGNAIFSRVIMGDFNGDGLSDALLFVQSNFQGYTLWGMNILTAAPGNKIDSLAQGPQISADAQSGQLMPVFGTIAVGDFNGDGSDEIAALLTDYQTVQFYTVNPQTLAITPSRSLKLPATLTPAGSLAAGRFRNTPNDELVAIGMAADGSYATEIYSIETMQVISNQNVFEPAVAATFKETVSNDYSYAHFSVPLGGVFAQAAPILNPYQAFSEQLVMGLKYLPGGVNTYNTGFVWIGSFDSNFNFSLNAYTDVLSGNGCLVGMQVGNFDNQQTDNNGNSAHNPNLQLALWENQGGGDALCTPNYDNGYLHLKIVNINVPSNYNVTNPPAPSNWLADTTDQVPDLGPYNNMAMPVTLSIGDLQGRSLRLGAPEVVTITDQIQPNIVLGMPPMHIDYINPIVPIENQPGGGCKNPPTPCILNLTVQPTATSPNPAFSTGFNFTSTADSTSSRTSTTSWGVSTKVTASLDASWGVPAGDTSSVSITATASYAHDNTVSKTYNTYNGTTDSLNASTGFGDHIFYTARTQHIYYYPVLGHTGCPASNPGCPDSEKVPIYVDFSVPDTITYNDVDATAQEWYQPAQEPGNILSYPWTLGQLQQQFSDAVQPLTTTPAPCKGTDSFYSVYTTNWNQGKSQGSSSGSSDTIKGDLSMSYSYEVGDVALGDGLKASFGIDIGTSVSLNTLDESKQSLAVSQGVSVTKPSFSSDIVNCCAYGFGSYLFGLSNPDPTFDNISIDDQNGKAVDIRTTGPLFVGFVADPVPNNGGGELGCGGSGSWWKQAYNLPDVGLNHPARWKWSTSTYIAAFNAFDNTVPANLQAAYWMKGLFITQAGAKTGMTIGSATAGDKLTLTARVYNFSLKDTNDPTLSIPASSIHVRFYGQKYCSSGNLTEPSCIDSNQQTCAAGTLCGNSFEIGETQLGSIPGFKSASTQGSAPNWSLASADFDTTGHDASNLIFWVVVWMEDANGNLVPEMPGHGLTGNPAKMTFSKITDVPIEYFTNNIGMYGAHTPFFVAPSSPGAVTGSTGPVKSVSLSLSSHKLNLDEDAQLEARFEAGSDRVSNATVAYYDGDPGTGGKLFDVQHIKSIQPGSSYTARLLYDPQTCGPHTLFAVASEPGLSSASGMVTTTVGIDAVSAVQSLITATEAADLPRRSRRLQNELEAAEESFRQQRRQEADDNVRKYVAILDELKERGLLTEAVANPLIAQANQIVTCTARASQ